MHTFFPSGTYTERLDVIQGTAGHLTRGLYTGSTRGQGHSRGSGSWTRGAFASFVPTTPANWPNFTQKDSATAAIILSSGEGSTVVSFDYNYQLDVWSVQHINSAERPRENTRRYLHEIPGTVINPFNSILHALENKYTFSTHKLVLPGMSRNTAVEVMRAIRVEIYISRCREKIPYISSNADTSKQETILTCATFTLLQKTEQPELLAPRMQDFMPNPWGIPQSQSQPLSSEAGIVGISHKR